MKKDMSYFRMAIRCYGYLETIFDDYLVKDYSFLNVLSSMSGFL